MQRRTKVIGAVGIAAVVAAGGSAFTAGLTTPADTAAGYSHIAVNGVTLDDINYTINTSDNITAVVFTLAAETSDGAHWTVGLQHGSDAAVNYSDCSETDTVNFVYTCNASVPATLISSADANHLNVAVSGGTT